MLDSLTYLLDLALGYELLVLLELIQFFVHLLFCWLRRNAALIVIIFLIKHQVAHHVLIEKLVEILPSEVQIVLACQNTEIKT